MRFRHVPGRDSVVKAEKQAQCQDRQLETLLPPLLYLVPAWPNAYPLGRDLDLAMAGFNKPPIYPHGRQYGLASAKLTSSGEARHMVAM
jgi:hypothetical protein